MLASHPRFASISPSSRSTELFFFLRNPLLIPGFQSAKETEATHWIGALKEAAKRNALLQRLPDLHD